MNKLRLLQEKIVAWRDKNVQNANITSTVEHLIEEAEHLKDNPYDPLSLADVGILFLSCCEQAGFQADDVLIAMESKMAINEAREWLAPDEHGIVRHKETKL